MDSDIGLERVGEEVLEEYETDVAADPRVPSIQWRGDEQVYRIKLYSDEFLENDSKSVAGTTLEQVIKAEAGDENDFYVELNISGRGLNSEREVYTFSEDNLHEGVRRVVEEYADDL